MLASALTANKDELFIRIFKAVAGLMGLSQGK